MSELKSVKSSRVRKLIVVAALSHFSVFCLTFSMFFFPIWFFLLFLVLYILFSLLFFYRLYCFLLALLSLEVPAGRPEAAGGAVPGGGAADSAQLVALAHLILSQSGGDN